MELIFEIINRSGKILERHKISGHSMSIGRAYDNDLILSDHYISSHHANINISDGQILITDLNSENGVRNIEGVKIENALEVNSGDEFILGKTHLRIYKKDHQVRETESLGNIDSTIAMLGKNHLGIASLLILLFFLMMENWLTSVEEFEWNTYLETAFILLIIAAGLALFWALIGRITKHEMFFRAQFTIILLYFCTTYVVTYIYELILFNSLNYPVAITFYIITGMLFLSALLWINLYISTHQNKLHRSLIAIFLSSSVVLYSISGELIEKNDFSLTPNYIAEVKPPIFRVVSGSNIDKFVENTKHIYSHPELN